jgi:hypothetical protein
MISQGMTQLRWENGKEEIISVGCVSEQTQNLMINFEIMP